MKFRILTQLIAVVVMGCTQLHADNFEILERTLAPDHRSAIRKDQNGDYEFIDMQSGKGIGAIEATEERSNISFVASWSPDGSKVALLMYYGTKLNCLLIYQKTSEGNFAEIPFKKPDPVELFQKKHRSEPFPVNSSGYSEDAVGPWPAKDTVRLIAGEAKEDLPKGHLFASFEVHIAKNRASIEKVVLHDLLSDTAAEKFLGHYGARH